jgi:hypothetical protein
MTAAQAQNFSDEVAVPMESFVEVKPGSSFLDRLMAVGFLLAAFVATGGWFWLLGQVVLSFLWPW